MRVSVCVPTYQGEAHLRAALDSALSQEGVDLEVIVLDNASSDGTAQILADIDDPRMRILRNPETVSLPENFRRVIEASTGEFVKVLCDDDLLLPGALASQAAILRDRPQVRLVACRRAFVDENDRVLSAGTGLRNLLGEHPGRAVAVRYARTGINPIGEPAGAMFRRDDYDAVGGWPSSEEWSFTSDLELWLRLLADGSLYGQGETLAAFRIDPNSLSQTADAHNQLVNERLVGAVAADPCWRMRGWDRASAAVVPRLTWQLWRLRRAAMRIDVVDAVRTDPADVVLVCGVGTGNIGNDASFETVRSIIAAERPALRVALATPFVAGAQEVVDVPVVPLRQDYTIHLDAGSPRRVALSVARGEVRRLAQLRRVQREARLIAVAGTGIFDDFSEHPWNMPYALLTWALAARSRRRPFAFMAVGAGPVHNPVSRREFAAAARLATSVSYRDADSRDFMAGIGAGRDDARVVPDVVFAHPVPPSAPARPTGDAPTVGIGVMAYGGWTQHGEGPIYEAYIATIAQVVTHLVRQGCGVRFLVGQPVDVPAVEAVIAACPADVAERLESPSPGLTDFASLLQAVGTTDLVVATRYHNIVAALMMRRPVVSASYAPKNAALLAALGVDGADRPVEQADADWILARVADLRSGRAGLPATVDETLTDWGVQVHAEVRRVLRGIR